MHISQNKQKTGKAVTSKINKNEEYPTPHVVASYLFLGGSLGGVVLSILVFIIDIMEEIWLMAHNKRTFETTTLFELIDNPLIIFGFIPVLVLFLLLGGVFGFVPALFTGMWLAWRKVYIYNRLSYLRVGLVGCVMTAICYLIVSFSNASIIFSLMLPLLMVGGISAVIMGYFVLPKKRNI